MIAEARLRSGKAGSGRAAASQIKQAIGTARACGASGTIMVRGDSAFGTHAAPASALAMADRMEKPLGQRHRLPNRTAARRLTPQPSPCPPRHPRPDPKNHNKESWCRPADHTCARRIHARPRLTNNHRQPLEITDPRIQAKSSPGWRVGPSKSARRGDTNDCYVLAWRRCRLRWTSIPAGARS